MKLSDVKWLHINDVQEPGWYAVATNNGRVVEGPKMTRGRISAEYRNLDGSRYEVVKITADDINADWD